MTTEQLQIIQQQQAEWKQKQQERFDTNKQRIFAALACAGVDEVTVAYSGEGDEGHLDDPEFYPEVDLRGQNVWIGHAQSVETSLRAAVEEFTSDLLDDQYGSWGDGEGSQGTVTWKVKDNQIHVSHGEPSWEYTEAEF